MKTVLNFILFLLVAGAFVACEKAEMQSPANENDLSKEKTAFDKNLKRGAGYSTRVMLYLDGIDDYIQVPAHSSLDMTSSFTVAAWVYMESYVEWASVVTKGGMENDPVFGDNNYTLHQSGNNAGSFEEGHIRFTGCIGLPTPLPESGTIMSLSQWYYVTVTFDGSILRFYLDGQPDGSEVLAGPLCTNSEPLNIGADFPGGDEYWHGAIDELRIWNIALADAQVLEAMAGNARLLATNLVGYWHFNEGSGTILTDYSGLGNHGAIMGGAIWIP